MDLMMIFGAVEAANSIRQFLFVVNSMEEKIDRLRHADLYAGIATIKQAEQSSGESQDLLRQARGFLTRAVSQVDGLNRAVARLGLALCHYRLNDASNAFAELHTIADTSFEDDGKGYFGRLVENMKDGFKDTDDEEDFTGLPLNCGIGIVLQAKHKDILGLLSAYRVLSVTEPSATSAGVSVEDRLTSVGDRSLTSVCEERARGFIGEAVLLARYRDVILGLIKVSGGKKETYCVKLRLDQAQNLIYSPHDSDEYSVKSLTGDQRKLEMLKLAAADLLARQAPGGQLTE
jgi:hypothetical protein